MQTFVPYGSRFHLNAQVLDRQRLGKQRVEGLQVIKALTIPNYGWRHHPAVKMWQGHVDALALYTAHMCIEWMRRGYADSVLPQLQPFLDGIQNPTMPLWLSRIDVMRSHRSNLIRKMPEVYQQVWPDVPDNLPYVWPTPTP